MIWCSLLARNWRKEDIKVSILSGLDTKMVGPEAAFSGASFVLHHAENSVVAIESRAVDLNRATRTNVGIRVSQVWIRCNSCFVNVNVLSLLR